jgi:LPXTG-motif cell wall-anchored protein
LDPLVQRAPAAPRTPVVSPAPSAALQRPSVDDDEPIEVPQTGFGSLALAVIVLGLLGLAAVLFKLAG